MNFIIKNKPTFYFFFDSPPKIGGDLFIISHIKTLINTGINVENFYKVENGKFWTAYAFPYHDSFKNYKISVMITPSSIVLNHLEKIYNWNSNSTITKAIHPTIQPSYNMRIDENKRKNNKICKISYVNSEGKRKNNTKLVPFLFLNNYPEYKNKIEFIEINNLQHQQASDVLYFSGQEYPNKNYNNKTSWEINNLDDKSVNNNIELVKKSVDFYCSNNETITKQRKELLKYAYNLVKQDFSVNTEETDIIAEYNDIYKQIKTGGG